MLPKGLGKEASRVCATYPLCDHCMGRIFAKRAGATGYATLGKRLRLEGKYKQPKKCHVCKGVFGTLKDHCDEMVRLTEDTEFDTFLVGATLRPSVLDADDAVRARYGLRGTQSAKSDITTTLSRMFARKTKSKPSIISPDITIKVDTRDGSVSIETRAVFVQARYTKSSRGIPQKADRCPNCSGRGCVKCAYRGINSSPSIESLVGGALCDITSARQARVLWFGSEESQSIVSGSGRPFIAKLVCPSRRRVKLFKSRELGHGVKVYDAKYVDSMPNSPPKFSFSAKIHIKTSRDIDTKAKKELRKILEGVRDYGSGSQMRKVHHTSYKATGPREILLELGVESGFPLRRFVESSTTSPNVTDLLETECKYIVADFADIKPKNPAKS